MAALGKLLDGAESDIHVHGRMLQFIDQSPNGPVRAFPLNLRTLHMVLAFEIGKLKPSVHVPTGKHEVLAAGCIRDPLLAADIQRVWGAKTWTKIEKIMSELGPAMAGLDLLQAAYGTTA